MLGGNCLAGCQHEDEKTVTKRSRGSVVASVENQDNMAIIKWHDNKSVTLLSSCAVEPQESTKFWSLGRSGHQPNYLLDAKNYSVSHLCHHSPSKFVLVFQMRLAVPIDPANVAAAKSS